MVASLYKFITSLGKLIVIYKCSIQTHHYTSEINAKQKLNNNVSNYMYCIFFVVKTNNDSHNNNINYYYNFFKWRGWYIDGAIWPGTYTIPAIITRLHIGMLPGLIWKMSCINLYLQKKIQNNVYYIYQINGEQTRFSIWFELLQVPMSLILHEVRRDKGSAIIFAVFFMI